MTPFCDVCIKSSQSDTSVRISAYVLSRLAVLLKKASRFNHFGRGVDVIGISGESLKFQTFSMTYMAVVQQLLYECCLDNWGE